MKKQLLSLTLVILLGGGGVLAQKNSSAKKKEIVIEKKINDGKPEKTIIIIDGDKVTVNGEEVKDFNGNFNFNGGNGQFNFKNLGEAFAPDADKFDFKGFNDSAWRPGKMFRHFEGMHSNKAMLGIVTEKGEQGAKITEITEESAAAKAGLQKDDIITAINADKITDVDELVKAVGKYKPEDVVDVTVLRNGQEKKFKATLGKNETPFSGSMNWNMNEDMMPPLPPMVNGGFDRLEGLDAPRAFSFNSDRPKFGFGIKDNENGDGAVVTNVKEDGAAAKAGLKENDVITEVAGTEVKTTDDLKRRLADNRDKTEITIKVFRSGTTQTITLKIPKKIKTAEL